MAIANSQKAANFTEVPKDIIVSTGDGRHLVLARKGAKLSQPEMIALEKKIERYGGLVDEVSEPETSEQVETSQTKPRGGRATQSKLKTPDENKSGETSEQKSENEEETK